MSSKQFATSLDLALRQTQSLFASQALTEIKVSVSDLLDSLEEGKTQAEVELNLKHAMLQSAVIFESLKLIGIYLEEKTK